ncbi:sialate O-acetylesterase [Aquisphaera insulae]|uniref:sialate O-acetylesterase n=1 Tax=Aquisphaera insulae TaxID=2712864 RepID=UPI0013EADB11|nr:sialate O-acetylesterase [Aquisphaera insulae]
MRRIATPGRSAPAAALLAAAAVLAMAPAPARADVKLPAIFGDHMVLQRGQADRIWGWADPGEEVTVGVSPGDQSKSAKAGADGKWEVSLDALETGGPYTITIKGKNTVTLSDVLSGEVWICSGQSNMQWNVGSANDADLEIRSAKFPGIRLITVPNKGTQEPQKDFQGKWAVCTPETVGGFSAVGYFFGRQIHQTLGVPVGLINDAWGGSACEAWIPREKLAADPQYKPLLDHWAGIEANYPQAKKAHQDWQAARDKAKAEGKPEPKEPMNPDQLMHGNFRPGNIYNGALLPTIGYGIRGAIWYQGESNSGRAYQYRHMFPLMIETWRDLWGQGDFSFYWVQLADFMGEKADPSESGWAELREAQTMTLKLPHTGEAVIIDLGEGKDIHPRNKQDVAKRLARWALAKDYGIRVPCQSPTYRSTKVEGRKAVLTFDHVDGGFRPFDVDEPRGFAVAGADRKFVKAQARITGPDTIEVWADAVSEPAAVRYAWADNPVCNLYSQVGLPLTPFRTDDWPGVTANNSH